jgi:hypothetical protein
VELLGAIEQAPAGEPVEVHLSDGRAIAMRPEARTSDKELKFCRFLDGLAVYDIAVRTDAGFATTKLVLDKPVSVSALRELVRGRGPARVVLPRPCGARFGPTVVPEASDSLQLPSRAAIEFLHVDFGGPLEPKDFLIPEDRDK